jgi:hypothetical protein
MKRILIAEDDKDFVLATSSLKNLPSKYAGRTLTSSPGGYSL